MRFILEKETKPYGIIICDDKWNESVFLSKKDIETLKEQIKEFEK